MSSVSHKPGIVLGIDGGGSKTAALIASFDKDGKLNILGQGRAGPSNLRLAGKYRRVAMSDVKLQPWRPSCWTRLNQVTWWLSISLKQLSLKPLN